MPVAPTTCDDFLDIVRKSNLVTPEALDAALTTFPGSTSAPDATRALADYLVSLGHLTPFQARELLKGRHKGFFVGKYKVLEPLGAGGMGKVFLCEHVTMKHRVAMKILPLQSAEGTTLAKRFAREAKAAANLNHPNIVRAHDSDQTGAYFYIIMDFVDGVSLHELIGRKGPLDPLRAAHYVAQVALGLQHIYEAGLVHRDIKPGNLMIDRSGTVKILDLGLARYNDADGDAEPLTKQYDPTTTLGTADYLAPEQAVKSYEVDIRADLYSLGATFYYLLSGKPPFTGDTIRKLMAHQLHEPEPLSKLCPTVPPAMIAVVKKLMAKKPEERYQTPIEVAEALLPWTQTPIEPPPDSTFPDARTGVRAGKPAPPSSTVRQQNLTPKVAHTSAPPARSSPGPLSTLPDLTLPEEKRKIPLALIIGGAVGVVLFAGVVLAVPIGMYLWSSPAPDTSNIAQLPPPTTQGKAPPKANPGTVTLSNDGANHFVKATKYEAKVEDDGSMTSLKVGGIEFLKPGVSISRGGYLYDQKAKQVIKLPKVDQPDNKTVSARNDKVTVRYECTPDALTVNVNNTGDQQLHYYLVFDPTVSVAKEGDEWVRLPAERNWTNSMWFGGNNNKIHIKGGNRIWGPWPQGPQGLAVWQLTVPGKQTKKATLEFGTATAAEANKVTAVLTGIPETTVPAYTFRNHDAKRVERAAAVPGENLVVTVGHDNRARVWATNNGQEKTVFEGHSQPPHYAAITTANGRLAATCGPDRLVKVWNLDDGKEVFTYKEHKTGVLGVTFSPDGKHIVSCDQGKDVRLWEARTGKEVRTFPGHGGPVYTAVFSADGKSLLTASTDKTVRQWNVADGKQTVSLTGSGGASKAVYVPGQNQALASYQDGLVILWDLKDKKEVRRFLGHQNAVWSVDVSWDGRWAVSGGDDKIVRVWDVSTGKEVHRYTGHKQTVTGVVFSGDGKKVISTSIDGTACVWNLAADLRAEETKRFIGHMMAVEAVAFSPDGVRAASASWDKTVRIWEVSSGKQLAQWDAHSQWAHGVVWHPNGRQLFSAGFDNLVKLWDDTGKEVRQYKGHTSKVPSVAVTPDGKFVAGGASDGTIRVWNVDNGDQVHLLTGHTKDVWSLAIAPDNKTLVSGSYDKTVKVWDLEKGQEKKTITAPIKISAVALSPDGKRVALGGFEGDQAVVHIADVETGQVKVRCEAPKGGGAPGLAWSADGTQVIAGGKDSVIRVYDATTGKLVKPYPGHAGDVWAIATSAAAARRGQFLSGGPDGVVRMWNLPSAAGQ